MVPSLSPGQLSSPRPALEAVPGAENQHIGIMRSLGKDAMPGPSYRPLRNRRIGKSKREDPGKTLARSLDQLRIPPDVGDQIGADSDSGRDAPVEELVTRPEFGRYAAAPLRSRVAFVKQANAPRPVRAEPSPVLELRSERILRGKRIDYCSAEQQIDLAVGSRPDCRRIRRRRSALETVGDAQQHRVGIGTVSGLDVIEAQLQRPRSVHAPACGGAGNDADPVVVVRA